MTHPNKTFKRAAAGVACLAAAVGALAGPSVASAQSVYPDLRMPSPDNLRMVFWPVASGENHHQLRFTTRPSNFGPGALEVHRSPTTSGIADLNQRIYQTPAGFRDENLGSVVFAPLDTLFPIPDLARYELWTQRAYERAQARNFQRGQPLYVHDNIGHCVLDDQPIDPDTPHVQGERGPYRACTKLVSGISVGWRTVQSWADDDQYIDLGLTALPDGEYVIRAIVDPTNLLWESPDKADPTRESDTANAGITYFRLAGGQLAGFEN